MRTTLVLDDDLVIKAKQVAASEHSTVSAVMNRALRELLTPSTQVREAQTQYRALTFGDPQRPVAMEPADIAQLEDADDHARRGY